MNFRNRVLAASCFVVLAGCAQTTPPAATSENWLGDASVGMINGAAVPASLLNSISLAALQKPAEALTAEERADLLEQLVTITLVADDAVSNQVDRQTEIAAELELRRMQQLASYAVEKYVEDNPPSEAELRTLYEERVQNLSGTEFKARHILLETEDEARDVIGSLQSGGDFAALAQEFSTGPTGPDGGDLGWFTPDRMVEPFANAVREMSVGDFSTEPVQTQFGWHVILVEESRDQQPPGIESMRAELVSISQRNKIDAYIANLRGAAEVSVE